MTILFESSPAGGMPLLRGRSACPAGSSSKKFSRFARRLKLTMSVSA